MYVLSKNPIRNSQNNKPCSVETPLFGVVLSNNVFAVRIIGTRKELRVGSMKVCLMLHTVCGRYCYH
jgi:hypothetical protein